MRPAKDFNKQKRPGGEHDAADDMTEGDSKNLLSYFRTSDVKIDD